jgi:hypothetical protein
MKTMKGILKSRDPKGFASSKSRADKERGMVDFMVGLAFMVMVLAPCVVAMGTGMHAGADLGVRDPAEGKGLHSGRVLIPR